MGSKFIIVKCKCGKESTIFGSASTEVRCPSCNEVLASPTGGKANVQTKITKVLE